MATNLVIIIMEQKGKEKNGGKRGVAIAEQLTSSRAGWQEILRKGMSNVHFKVWVITFGLSW